MKSPKLSLVVPFRNRESHLEEFIPHIKDFLDSQKIDFKIFVIEQGDDKPFNRAKLFNVGFKESEHFDYFCFHDVDLLPVTADYTYTDKPTHLSSHVEQFNFEPYHEEIFGGVVLFPKDDFKSINGYSNLYWGWGAEDDDVKFRCKNKKIEIYRRYGKYRSLPHERSIKNSLYEKNCIYMEKQKETKRGLKIMEQDGLNSLEYTKVFEKRINEFTTLINVLI